MEQSELCSALSGLLTNGKYEITLLANASALINGFLTRINWVGFYLHRDGQLILGPFQGKPACEVIPMDKGVCGHAASRDAVTVVRDVHEFAGHIACDPDSRSEIVLPIHVHEQLYGVLDIDSPYIDRFSEDDENALSEAVKLLEKALENIL